MPCLEENQTETSGNFTNFGKHRKRNKINPARLIAAKRCRSYKKFSFPCQEISTKVNFSLPLYCAKILFLNEMF